MTHQAHNLHGINSINGNIRKISILKSGSVKALYDASEPGIAAKNMNPMTISTHHTQRNRALDNPSLGKHTHRETHHHSVSERSKKPICTRNPAIKNFPRWECNFSGIVIKNRIDRTDHCTAHRRGKPRYISNSAFWSPLINIVSF